MSHSSEYSSDSHSLDDSDGSDESGSDGEKLDSVRPLTEEKRDRSLKPPEIKRAITSKRRASLFVQPT